MNDTNIFNYVIPASPPPARRTSTGWRSCWAPPPAACWIPRQWGAEPQSRPMPSSGRSGRRRRRHAGAGGGAIFWPPWPWLVPTWSSTCWAGCWAPTRTGTCSAVGWLLGVIPAALLPVRLAAPPEAVLGRPADLRPPRPLGKIPVLSHRLHRLCPGPGAGGAGGPQPRRSPLGTRLRRMGHLGRVLPALPGYGQGAGAAVPAGIGCQIPGLPALVRPVCTGHGRCGTVGQTRNPGSHRELRHEERGAPPGRTSFLSIPSPALPRRPWSAGRWTP